MEKVRDAMLDPASGQQEVSWSKYNYETSSVHLQRQQTS
jgi:hypothetical protein